MNPSLVSAIGPIIAILGVGFGIYRAIERNSSRQAEKLQAALLGVQWLISHAGGQPDTYLADRIREALK